MPTTRTRPTRAQTRSRILAAAFEVFAAHGYDGASVDAVAAEAGLTKGAVYSSFASKDELFLALVTDRLDARLKLVTDKYADPRDLRTLFDEAETDLATLFSTQKDWHLLFIEAWARATRDPQRRAAWAAQRRVARTMLSEFFERHAAATGLQLPAPAEDLALAAMALSNGLAMEYIADPDSTDPRLFARTLGLLIRP